ncbi:MAG: hypothetical protein ACJ764_15250 [Solirubrobacteraceae bacterium]
MTRTRFDGLDQALQALQVSAEDLRRDAPRRPLDAKIRQFAPVQQVAARLELAGPQRLSPSVQAGLDIRGDGSTEAFMGRVRRRVVEQKRGEDAYRALSRAVRARL